MNDREFLEWMAGEIDTQLATDPDGGGGGDTDSPTGRKPRLVWTPDRQRCLDRMREEGEAGDDTLGGIWYRLIKKNAEGDRYGDIGTWATLMYQMTGDAATWIPHAWKQIESMLASALDDDNNTREYAAERVILLDWLWPGLTDDQRSQYFEALDRMFTNANLGAVRLNDSDQSTGVYFGVAFYGLAFGDIHPAALDFFNHAQVGGLDATGCDIKSTLRNAVAWFVQAAAGGEWIESSEYNLGTVRLLLLGAAGVKTASGADHFPEITEWEKAAASRYHLMTTPDFDQSFQWGDEQNPRAYLGWSWSSTAMMVNAPIARQYVYDLVDVLGPTGSYTAEPTVGRAFYLFDPYGPVAPVASPVFDAHGQGILTVRPSLGDPDASMLCTHFSPTPNGSTVDHLVGYFADLHLYRRRGWALTRPITYSGPGMNGFGTNGMLHRGQGSPRECRTSIKSYRGSDWSFVAGTAGGTILQSKFYQPPPTFWYEWSRSILWIRGEVDTLVVFDRSHLDDPLALAGCSKYPDDIEKEFNENPLRSWRWHCPVPPTLDGRSATWPIANEEHARVSWLRDDLAVSIHDQSVEWSTTNMIDSERKFHLELDAPDRAGFETLVTVLEFGDPSKFSAITLHTNTAEDALACVLKRSGRSDWAVLLNAIPGPKLPTYGGASAYHPDIPDLLGSVRFRDFAVPTTGARVWGMETASGVAVFDPS